MSVSTLTGAKAIGPAVITGTTGSPTVDTTSRPGKTIYKFTGSGSITVATAGNAEILVIGGGGGAGFGGNQPGGGGGAGGYVYRSSVYLPSGAQTITIGAGGSGVFDSGFSTADITNGEGSRLGDYVALGGGAGGVQTSNPRSNGRNGGSGGGAVFGYTGGSALLGQGNNGASNGGGGGSGGAGSGSSGGAGTANSITGTSVTYAAGGTRSANNNGTANTGNGAGSGTSNANQFSGGSGYVVVVV